MPTGMLAVVLLLVTVFIIVYKRQMLIKMFSINIASMADEFRTQMEVTADQAVKKLEYQMSQLEYMLEEADAKIRILEDRLHQAEQKCNSQTTVALPQTMNHTLFIADGQREPIVLPPESSTVSDSSALQGQPSSQFVDKQQQVAAIDKRKQVISMHLQGYNVVEIAKATAMGKGEVMLVLELNKN